MAGIFWINNKEDDYFGHEIYLLPGQMIPEHRHLKTEEARPKMEGWQPRHGFVWTYAEGEPNAGDEKRIPGSHRDIANAREATKVMPGEVTYLAEPEQWHFMLAGPEGAIVTEYASYHDNAALRFSHPDVQF
jgi:D-lyxose ketol-isomerase